MMTGDYSKNIPLQEHWVIIYKADPKFNIFLNEMDFNTAMQDLRNVVGIHVKSVYRLEPQPHILKEYV